MTDQQLQAIKEEYSNMNWDDFRDNAGDLLQREIDIYDAVVIDGVPALVAEVERLRKEVHGHEQSLLHDTYSEFTAKREIEQLRQTLAAVNETIGTYLKAYHYPVYEQVAKALEEGEGSESRTS